MSRYKSIGAIYVSALRTGMGVALKIPDMARRQLFCITESLLADVFDFLTSLDMCHTVDPYVMTRRNYGAVNLPCFGQDGTPSRCGDFCQCHRLYNHIYLRFANM